METRICRLYGQNDLRVETAPVPDPGPGEVLVAVAAGGICGSDLHYFQDGGIGTIRVREPIILGHEASGTVLETGPGVTGLETGARVALNPARPCGSCEQCALGLPIHCLNMRFNGSAMRFPHEQGLFRDRVVVAAGQCVPVCSTRSLAEAACAEPLAVCLHAHTMAGMVEGKRVLVTGAGPIGTLCAALAVQGGAEETVITDLQDFPLSVASKMGVSKTINMIKGADALKPYARDKGRFDLVFECSAAAPAIATALECLRPRGTMIQVGVAGPTPIPLNLLVGKEITYRGTQRFAAEFTEATRMISSGDIDVGPIITGSFPMDDAENAFAAAADRSRSVKVHLTF